MCCHLTLLIFIVQAGMTQCTTGHWVVITAETREGRKSLLLWDSALLIKQWLSGEFLVHEPWQLHFNWISIFRNWMKNFFLYHSAKGSDGSPHFPNLPGQGGKAPSFALQPMRQSLISAEAIEQNYQLSVLQVLLPYRCTLSKAKLKRISSRIAKDISLHQGFSMTNVKVLLQTPEVREWSLHTGGRAPVFLAYKMVKPLPSKESA